MSNQINMHSARTRLNRDPDFKRWAEAWLKHREREREVSLTDEEFEKHWRYVTPERMHEGALDALNAFQTGN